ncbi:TlpA family protein disulfide reductase [Paracidovorax wautersii]|uniref:Thiol-disulfide isomerase or thioredoxin n=1 Tax=Paracidovorax wautersii TaxID=1177982 RepID=A0A1I2G4Y8_9BURK|nr:TlpA disulfide reductase family protein [Paracidovorax wautersii]SFF11691.1 Thiol-disulfide isomerase or thioredoxin [Paracidovorax wautersii]
MNSPTPSPSPAPVPSATTSRRRWLAAGVGAAAAVAGAGLAWQRLQPHAAPAALSETETAFWASGFNAPAGDAVAMQSFRGKPLVLNFWATWCPPCVEELPLLNGFYREQKARGWQVVGLAIDQPTAVRQFLQRLPLDFPIALGGLGGTDMARSLGNLAGGLPFTVVFGADGNILHRKMGQVTADDLKAWAQLG